MYYVKFQIKDSGCGIALENQNKIFEKFVQIDRNEEDYQGTGLGLSIVKRLLEFMGSEIKITSEVGVGTEMIFTIPFEYNSDLAEKLKKSKLLT